MLHKGVEKNNTAFYSVLRVEWSRLVFPNLFEPDLELQWSLILGNSLHSPAPNKEDIILEIEKAPTARKPTVRSLTDHFNLHEFMSLT